MVSLASAASVCCDLNYGASFPSFIGFEIVMLESYAFVAGGGDSIEVFVFFLCFSQRSSLFAEVLGSSL